MLSNDSPFNITRYTDTYGNLTTKKRTNRQFQIYGSKTETGETLVESNHVYIDGLYETAIQNQITDPTYFKVDYKEGIIYFHPSKEGQFVNATFYAKAKVDWKALNVILLDTENHYPIKTVEAALQQTAQRIDNLVINTANPTEVLDSHIDSINNVTFATQKARFDRDALNIKNLQGVVGDGELSNTDYDNIIEGINLHQREVTDLAINVISKGIKGNGTDETSLIQSILDNAINSVLIPANTTVICNNLTISKSNMTLIIKGVLKVETIEITGIGSGIICDGGYIDGKLKYAKTISQVSTGSNQITVENGHNFVVGDGIQSSYGLGSDGSNPIQVTSVNGNVLTVANPTVGVLPVNAYIGNYHWSATVILSAKNTFLKNVKIINSRGYALSINNWNKPFVTGIVVDGCTFDYNGLDIVQIINAQCEIKNTYFLTILDAAKQGIDVVESKVKLTNCTFNRLNSDVDIYITGNNTITEIECNYCKFIGSGNIHPAPYDVNSWSCLQFVCSDNSTINNIKLNNCVFQDYSQGFMNVNVGNTSKIGINIVRVSECTLLNTPFGRLTNVTLRDCKISNSTFDGQSILNSDTWWLIDNNGYVSLCNCTIKNDKTTKIFGNVKLIDCELTNLSNMFFNQTSYVSGLILNNTSINIYPYYDTNAHHGSLHNLIFNNPSFTTDGNLDNHIVLKRNNSVIDFSFLNGTLSGKIYYYNYHSYYTVDLKICNSQKPQGLYGDDWRIPVNSLVEDVLTNNINNKFKVVTKSYTTTTYTVGYAGTNSIIVNDATGINIGDYINFQSSNGNVFTSKVATKNNNTITLEDNFINDIYAGSNVCAYLY